jgi:EmrB/QacA subfamily drug resistance transporter
MSATEEISPFARKLIPLVVAAPMFLQNLTSSVLATALPSIASAIQSDPLHLNLAITLYLLAVAVALPLAAWLADRVGSRRLFCIAMAVFALGSVGSALSHNLWQLAASRAVQGIGGALMLPVGRLILLRTIPANEIVKATIWYTVPPVIGATLGPLVGAFIVTYMTWPWLFLINIPVAAVSMALALKLLKKDVPGKRIPLDHVSYLLMALTLLCLLSGMAGSGKGLLAPSTCLALIAMGALFSWAYFWHSRRAMHPVMDFTLLRFKTYNASIVGGTWARIGQGAGPFLLPLLFQLGLGMSPMNSGTLIFIWALGSLFTRPVLTWSIKMFGFRQVLIYSTIGCSLGYISLALVRPGVPIWVLVCILALTGGARGTLMVSMNALGYTEIPKPRMSYATALSTMSQQVSGTFGVALVVLLLNFAMDWRNSTSLTAIDFAPAFVAVGLLNLVALFYFIPLPKNVGAELMESNES